MSNQSSATIRVVQRSEIEIIRSQICGMFYDGLDYLGFVIDDWFDEQGFSSH